MNKENKISEEFPQINGYKVIRFLAAGSMGKVFSAIDLKSKQEVAIKVMHSHLCNAENKERFLREVKIMEKVSHANIVKIHADGQCSDGSLYMVMQLIKGVEVHELLKKKKVFTPSQALSIVLQAAQGLDYAHKNGIVHRDVKPQNLVLDIKTKRVLLVDFGIAKAFDSNDLTRQGSILGSPSFMSPEQAIGKRQTEKSDIYSLGTVLFKLVVGRNIYQGMSAMDVLAQHVKDDVPKLPETHAQLQPLLDTMCSKDPRDRPSAASVLKIIKVLLKNPDIKSLPAIDAPVETEQEKEESIVANILGSTAAISKQEFIEKDKDKVEGKPSWRTLLLISAFIGLMVISYLSLYKGESLTVLSSEASSVLYLDGEKQGEVPLTLKDLSKGRHELFLVHEVSAYERLVAKRQVHIPMKEESVFLNLQSEFLHDGEWLNKDSYSEALVSKSANKYLGQAYLALKRGDLFSNHDSAYFLYLKAEQAGKKDPLFIVRLDKSARDMSKNIYESEGFLALKIYLDDLETAWQKRPWMNHLLESIQAEEMAKKKQENLEKKQVSPAKYVQLKPKPAEKVIKKKVSYQDCSYCPEMIKLDAGKVTLGVVEGDNAAKENEKKAYQTYLKAFYIAKNLVTVEDFSLFLNAKKKQDQVFFNTDKARLSFADDSWAAKYGSSLLPMTYVSYQGAEAYCSWLGEITAFSYRLPKEEEWEYAGRAGAKTIFWWGNDSKKGMANVLGTSGADQWSKLSPIASFSANSVGLYDMGGNVWQWTSSREKQASMVIKGGSWMNLLEATRPSRRSFAPESTQSSKIGFRCVRD